MGLERDAVTLLQQLLRHRTVNPPGDERALQVELAAHLEAAGFEVTLVGRTDARPNLVARLRGAADGPVLCLLSHVDTVLADPADWTTDPWSGEERDGCVWGRGAVDMKSQTAAEVAAAVDLARSGWRPARGELLVVAVVDEEVGGTDGALWLCEHHPDLVRCDELLNEGAGAVIPHDGGRLIGVSVAEKGIFRATLEVHGRAGHASMPGLGDNALPRLVPLITALAEARPPVELTEAPRLLLEALGVTLDELRAVNPALAGFVEPMAGMTIAPTMVRGSEKINVLPARASVRVDCRTPPGMDGATAEARLRAVLGDPAGYDLRVDEVVVGSGSPAGTGLYGAIERWVAGELPDARVVPTMLPAYTDSKPFRETFGATAYGFMPMAGMSLFEMWPLIHGADERIPVADVGLAARAFRAIVRDRLGG